MNRQQLDRTVGMRTSDVIAMSMQLLGGFESVRTGRTLQPAGIKGKDRNRRCPCRSGRKVKHCCGHKIYEKPGPVPVPEAPEIT